MNIFEQATRMALRFDSSKGLLTTEDLWKLPLTSSTGKTCLDEIAVSLHNKLKDTPSISFVKPAAADAVRDVEFMKFDVIKHIIDVRVAERDAAAEASKRADTKQKILGLIAQKEDQELAGKSKEELLALANSL